MKTNKLTRKYFILIYPEMSKVRRNDPIDFEIRFHNWKRLRNRGNI
jgi:hypothetical protein